jgi:glycosyltransferase involved in cell wall biosynthesis
MKENLGINGMKEINIAFGIMGGESWTFGTVYLNDLIKSLKQYGPKNYNFFIFVPHSYTEKLPDVGNDVKIIWSDEVEKKASRNPISIGYHSIINRIFKKKSIRNLKKHNIDILFSQLIDYPIKNVKTLSWLPDFQHIPFPEMFSNHECQERNKIFKNAAKYSSRVILISEAAKRDFQAFAPEYLNKVRVYPPISLIDPTIYDIPLSSIVNRYDLPEKYIFLPNQFWKHKNHSIVFKAIKILKERGVKVYFVCAGNACDYRHLAYFSILNRKISECKLRDQIIYIGIIPRTDVLLLMRQSVCLINPSLFEGFGFTVDEARTLGKKIIASDIPPHREQDPPEAIYFNPCDAEELADKIGRIWLKTPAGPDYKLEMNARNDYSGRMRENIKIFTSIIEETMKD